MCSTLYALYVAASTEIVSTSSLPFSMLGAVVTAICPQVGDNFSLFFSSCGAAAGI